MTIRVQRACIISTACKQYQLEYHYSCTLACALLGNGKGAWAAAICSPLLGQAGMDDSESYLCVT